MRRIVLLVALSLLLAPISPAVAVSNDGPRYDVRLGADASGVTWTGRERVTFTNTSAGTLSEVYLRLWGNAWDGCNSSPVRVSHFAGGTPGTASVACTALPVALTQPVAPGKQISIAFDLSITAPDRAEKFGRSGDYSFFGNALPVLAIHDQAGWHLEPDVGIGESYYAAAADFAVRLDHPAAVQVPATGTESGGVITAKQVRDFAWAAGPFEHSEVTSPGGVKVRTWWTSVVTAGAVATARTGAVAAVDDFGRRFGTYPYGELDLVLNDKWAAFSGMEYPGFVLLVAPPYGESAAVHEVAHQWWYGIVGNNEYADPWLDESFATYSADLFAGDAKPGCWPGSVVTSITNSMAYWKAHPTSYGTYVYTYGACMLHDLDRLIGGPAMATLLKTYALTHWYGIATPAAFKQAAQSATAIDLTSFWSGHSIG
ncbi:M1 family metallopeptidase [Kribbella monticola]|uniref:M1 family metallopeptidase n=1 Tax=Kribbella monticola TaxID=2185285 RepID=UPI000DD40AAF|nr:M1 family metallopeptidase [Kribbella monticola]